LKRKLTLVIIAVVVALYVVPLVLLVSLLKEKAASIPHGLVEAAALCGMLGIFIAAHVSRPKLPDVKPLLLLPNTKSIKLRNVLALLFGDISKWYPFLLLMAGLHAVVFVNGDYLRGAVVSVTLICLYAATLLAAWMTGIALRFARSERNSRGAYVLSVSIFTALIVFFATINLGVLWIKYAIGVALPVVLCSAAYVSLKRNVGSLLDTAFEPLNYVNAPRIAHEGRAHTRLPIFFQKEWRMCFRSRRIRVLFYLVPVYAAAVSTGLFLKGNTLELMFMSYLVTTGLAMNYNEYWERFWAWDRSSHGLILSVPDGRQRYFVQKIACSLVFGATVLPVHFFFFEGNHIVGIIGGLLFLGAVPILTSYDSMNNGKINADLNASLWTKITFNIHFMISLLGMAAANWYLFFKNDVLLGKLLYILFIVVLVITAVKRLYTSLQRKEWAC